MAEAKKKGGAVLFAVVLPPEPGADREVSAGCESSGEELNQGLRLADWVVKRVYGLLLREPSLPNQLSHFDDGFGCEKFVSEKIKGRLVGDLADCILAFVVAAADGVVGGVQVVGEMERWLWKATLERCFFL